MAKLGFLILGQTPRPDIDKTYRHYLPNVTFLYAGGLDGLTNTEIDALADQPATYPLLTLLSDGSSREIDMAQLIPRLELQAQALKDAGADVLVLMCAGQFPDLNVDLPVIYPQRVVQAVATAISSTRRIRIISPNEAQLPVAITNWQHAGFTVSGRSASPLDAATLTDRICQLEADDDSADCLVLDCMGFSPDAVTLAKRSTPLPVLCPQRLVAKIVAELLNA